METLGSLEKLWMHGCSKQYLIKILSLGSREMRKVCRTMRLRGRGGGCKFVGGKSPFEGTEENVRSSKIEVVRRVGGKL